MAYRYPEQSHPDERAGRAALQRQPEEYRLPEAERERRIVSRMNRAGLSQIDLHILTGIGQNEISKIETGERQRPRPQFIEALARELRVPPAQVMLGDQQRPISKLSGRVQGDGAILIDREARPLLLKGITLDQDAEGYEVETDTLEPRFHRGDVLICSPEGASLEESIGRECLVDLNEKRYVRLVEKGASGRVVTLRPYRATTPLFVDEKPKRVSPIVAIIPRRGPHAPPSQSN